MNGYQIDAELSKKYLEEHPDLDEAKKEHIKTTIECDMFLAKQTQDGINELFNSGAFNQICKGYCEKAMGNCQLDKDTIDQVMRELEFLFSTITADWAVK